MAFGKLHGVLPSKPLSLPGKNPINIALMAGNLAAAGTLLTTGDPATGLAALCATTALGGVMGAHMTASIGGEAMHAHVHLPAVRTCACMHQRRACMPVNSPVMECP